MNVGGIGALVFVVALLYSSVGFGGASSYLAVMSLFDMPPAFAATIALTLNILVASIAFVNYYRMKYFRWELLWPFLITSIPAAFVGGMIKLGATMYAILLNGVLLYVALRLFLMPNQSHKGGEVFPLPKIFVALSVGAVLGLISGMIGIGGGIFLSPLIVLAKWGSAKHAAAVSSAFIVINSISGLIGRALGGSLDYGSFGVILIAVGIVGGFLGSYWGSKRLSSRGVQILLGVVLLVVVGKNMLM
ncbi:MAG: sulfite exporter TauE/SafE family protein [Chloroflexota bacterium]